MRIGIDLGGTKIAGIALADDGRELGRHRVPTPRDDYPATLAAVAGMVRHLESEIGEPATVGLGMPGSLSPTTGRVRNANSVWLIGQPIDRDLAAELGREVRCANDANCLAVSEATDGAGAGARVVFAVILGTGVGAGITVDGALVAGRNGVAGEWGHNPLPWATGEEVPGPDCSCGRRGRYVHRLARGLAHVAHVCDPDVFVLAGGVSNIRRRYEQTPALLPEWTFGGEADTPIVQAVHGDSSGVRGAAGLWPAAGAGAGAG